MMETNRAKEPNIKYLEERAYQEELFQKSLLRNTIVYLGTGSGKTYVAVRLINHYRGKLKDGNKIIFLVNNVALVDQQALVIRDHSGLSVGSYCGADGVDDWDDATWRRELDRHQVLVLVHQVFEDMLKHSYFQLSQAVLLIMDECHHAVKKHPYSNIMGEWYWMNKEKGKPVPKILGLTACVVVQTVNEIKFKENKAKLENKMDATVTTTEDLAEILKYVTNPKEEILWYPTINQAIPIADTIAEVINVAISEVDQEKAIELERINEETRDKNSKACQEGDLMKDFKTLKNEIFLTMEFNLINLGLETLHKQIPGVETYLQRQKQKQIFYSPKCQQKFLNISKEKVQSCKELAIGTIDNFEGSKLEKIMKFTSPKVHALLDILREKKETSPDMNDSESIDNQKVIAPVAAIIFVERRSTAEVLCRVIQELADLDPSLSHIRADFCTRGEKVNIKNPKERETAMIERKKLLETLSRFKRGETNVLVATRVIEEGIDVRRCNLVIKFDHPMEFRSYVQSKGRARAHPSRYIIMAGDTEFSDIQRKYYNYRNVEELSIKLCHNETSLVDMEKEEREEPYLAEPDDPENSARLNGSQAISLVHQYLQKIPVDRFTKLTPAWEIEEVKGDSQAASSAVMLENLIQYTPKECFSENDKSFSASMLAAMGIASPAGFRVTCTMPHKTPIHEPVVGEVRPTKDWAKRCCALMVCRLLHEEGELDNRLKVRRRKNLVEEDEEEADEDLRGYKAGTKRRRRIYEKKIPEKLAVVNGGSMFLHLVEMDLVEPIQNPRYRLHESTEHHLGMLLPSVQSSMGPFSLFSASGRMDVQIKYLGQYEEERGDLKLIQDFHNYVFSHILNITDYMNTHTGSYLVVPMTEKEKNYIINKEMLRHSCFSSPISKIPNLKSIYEQVVFPTYKGTTHSHYFVEEVLNYLTAKNCMPQRPNETKSLTFMEYYSKKYGYEVQDPNQPVLRVSSADKRPYMLKEGHEQHGEGGRRSDPEHLHERMLLLPELLGVEPVPTGLWRQCQILPFVLHRVHSLLGVEEIQQRLMVSDIGMSGHLRLGVEDLKGLDHVDGTNTFNKLLLPDCGGYAPNVPQLLQALTLKCTDDHFDMERLEILGDVYLKYKVSVGLYYKFTGDEGQLTLNRSKIVGNKNLFECAKRIGMERAVVSEKMEIHGGWQVPGFTRKTLEDKLVEMDRGFMDHVEESKKGRVGTGSMMEWIVKDDLEMVVSGKEEEVLKKAVSRFNEGKTEGRVVLKEYKVLADKSLADCVEAVIGCNLLVGGQKKVLEVMKRMDVMKRIGVIQFEWDAIELRKDAFINEWRRAETEEAQELYEKMELRKIEQKIGYRFKEKSFLLQAFTHASAGENRLTESYERLEYLGDAVLDYLVTCFVYCHTNYGPGKVTDARSALVNNNMFASVLVDNNLHPYILHSSPRVLAKIEEYLNDRREDGCTEASSSQRLISSLELFNEVEVPELTLVEVPKVLGDVLEALIGAVYEDSGHDLAKVWHVYQRLCPNFGDVVKNPPLNMKKQLMEKFPDKVKYSKAKVEENRVSMVATVEVRPQVFKKFRGIGSNKKNAMMAASKCASRKLVAVDIQN